MPIVSNCVILIALVANGLSLVYLWSSWTKFLIMANLVLGVISLILMWIVQCSDPGIQSRTKGKEVEANNPEFNINDSQLSMNIQEKGIFDPENYNQKAAEIYDETPFYFYRYCTTCDILRKPKASHCATCNNCVVGYDHHCTLLNNCIGKRNIRAFNSLLVCVWTFALITSVVAVLIILKEPVLDQLEQKEKIIFEL